MDLERRLAVSYYKTIAPINEAHKIYLVQHMETGRIYVKKILDVYNLDVYKNLFEHPVDGTPKIIDYCEEDDHLILIEEYISGTPLSAFIEEHSLSLPKIRSYLLDLCGILESLHAAMPPVVHRDIKPSNIIITNYDNAILLDFNAAKQFSPTAQEDTILIGTQGYAAPEQYGFGASTPQTDIYSLGVVLKEMLTSCNLHDISLEKIADKCTQISPKERYLTVSELKEEILLLGSKTDTKQSGFSKYLLPGYRTRTPWKMILASVTYLFLLALCFTLDVKGYTGISLWVERFFALSVLLSIILGSFNYLGIQRFIPLCKNKTHVLRVLGIVILDIALALMILFILLLLEGTLMPPSQTIA